MDLNEKIERVDDRIDQLQIRVLVALLAAALSFAATPPAV